MILGCICDKRPVKSQLILSPEIQSSQELLFNHRSFSILYEYQWIVQYYFKKHLEGKLITGCTLIFYKCHSTFIPAKAAIYANQI